MKIIIAFFIIISLILLSIATLTYMFFWYEFFNSSLNSSNKKCNFILILKSIIRSFFSLWFILIIYPFNIFIPKYIKVNKTTYNKLPNIILIHGLFHNKSAWIYILVKLILSKKINAIYLINYNSYLYSFKEILKQIENSIYSLTANKSNNQIILIGHSLGGLFCYALCQNQQISSQINCIITLGTPYKGSKLAAFGISKLARELRYKGELVNEFKKANIASHIKGFIFYSPIDNLVLPNSSLKSPISKWQEIITAPVNHVAMLYNTDIANKIIKIITNC